MLRLGIFLCCRRQHPMKARDRMVSLRWEYKHQTGLVIVVFLPSLQLCPIYGQFRKFFTSKFEAAPRQHICASILQIVLLVPLDETCITFSQEFFCFENQFSLSLLLKNKLIVPKKGCFLGNTMGSLEAEVNKKDCVQTFSGKYIIVGCTMGFLEP